MKKTVSWKRTALGAVTLLAAVTLAACGNGSDSSKGSSANTSYSYVYSIDPTTLDYLYDNHSTSSDITNNLIDGLLENDQYGNLIPSLAENWTVSEDGLTYTYKLREGAKWYTADGEEYAEVTAHDFVTGLKHAADKDSLALPIIQNSIAGLDAYVKGESTDFSTVGIKAVDDYTVEYTLNQPEPFWNSKTTLGVLFPVNEEFLTSQGENFATPTDPSTLLYNGAYILSAVTSKSAIEFTKNENYWDADNVHITDIKLTYYDGSDPASLVKGFDEGAYTNARIFPNTSTYEDVKKEYGDNIYYTQQGMLSFYAMLNVDRQSYAHTAKTTNAEKTSSKKALQNKDFRQALTFAFDRTAYNAQGNGEDAAAKRLRNILVAPGFVTAGEDDFGTLTEKALASYGDEWKGVELDDAQDGFYNPEKAQAEFAKAKATLEKEGVTFPIRLDVPVDQANEIAIKGVQSMKKSIEDALGAENVQIDILQLEAEAVDKATYYAETAAQADYDINMASGWGPDYLDPSTYLDIFDASLAGSMTRTIGFDGGSNSAVAKAIGFDTYTELLKEANAERLDYAARIEKYANAQAWLTEEAVIIPYISNGGTSTVSKIVPFTAAYTTAGIKGGAFTFKYVQLQSEPVTVEQYEKAREKWLEEKAKSNEEAEKALADHVE